MPSKSTGPQDYKYYTGVPCESVYHSDTDQFSNEFHNQVNGFLCAETGGFDLLDGDLKSTARDGSSYYFVVDTCMNIATATNSSAANCKTQQESLDNMNMIGIDWKLANAFFAAETYVMRGEHLSYAFYTHNSELSQSVSQR